MNGESSLGSGDVGRDAPGVLVGDEASLSPRSLDFPFPFRLRLNNRRGLLVSDAGGELGGVRPLLLRPSPLNDDERRTVRFALTALGESISTPRTSGDVSTGGAASGSCNIG